MSPSVPPAAATVVGALCALAACHPRVSLGYDMSAHTRGPLAHVQAIPRLAAGGTPAPPPSEGRNVSGGIAFGDQHMMVGVRVHANNVAGDTLDASSGPQYLSGAVAFDLRYSPLRLLGFSPVMMLAPSTTALVDSTTGWVMYGAGIRYGAGLSYSLKAFSIYADAYQEKLMFQDGPAAGNSTREGITVGVAFQP